MSKVFKELVRIVHINIQDILIWIGIAIFIITMFKFVSAFAGYMSLSIVFIILGLILSKIKGR